MISEVRTDLDAFTDAEICVLENHGYLLAEAAIKTHSPGLVAIDAALVVPHRQWEHEARVAEALATSGDRRILGRS